MCSGYGSYLTAKNYESNAGLDLQRPKPDPLADTTHYTSINMSQDDFRYSMVFPFESLTKSQNSPLEKAKLTESSQTHQQKSGLTSPIKYSSHKFDYSAPQSPLLKNSGTNRTTAAEEFPSPIKTSESRLVQNKVQLEKIVHADPIASNAEEKMLYLFSPEHRSSRRREENQKYNERTIKQMPSIVKS